MNYNKILSNLAALGRYSCLGLDVDYDKLPKSVKGDGLKEKITACYDFLLNIIVATGGNVQSYKPNLAFFERFGGEGISMLEEIVRYIRKKFPDVFLIGDGKRGDIGNTNMAYMEMLEIFDAFTIAPYLGGEANKPFFFKMVDEKEVLRDKLVFVLCQTSNEKADEIQGLWTLPFNPAAIPDGVGKMDWWDKIVTANLNGEILPLYQNVAKKAITWSPNVGLVTGATYPENMAAVRRIIGDDRYLLIPGHGTQEGDLEASLDAGMTRRGRIVLNVSRAALYGSKNEDYAEVCNNYIVDLNGKIMAFRRKKYGEFA